MTCIVGIFLGILTNIYSLACSKTKGLFAGISIEGSIIIERKDANSKFYGQKVNAKELLNGTIPPPIQADVLYRSLNSKFTRLGSTSTMYTRFLFYFATGPET